MRQLIVPSGGGVDYDWGLDHMYVKTPVTLAGGRVTVVEDKLKPGFHLDRHHHKVMAEIFYVLEGSVLFKFDDEVILAEPGMTVNVPANVWHDVGTEKGCKLLTVFSPGGFDSYLKELSSMTAEELASEAGVTLLSERYDIWNR